MKASSCVLLTVCLCSSLTNGGIISSRLEDGKDSYPTPPPWIRTSSRLADGTSLSTKKTRRVTDDQPALKDPSLRIPWKSDDEIVGMLKAAISAFKFKRARRDNGPSSPDAGAQSNLTESDIVRIVSTELNVVDNATDATLPDNGTETTESLFGDIIGSTTSITTTEGSTSNESNMTDPEFRSISGKLVGCPLAWPFHDPYPVADPVCQVDADCTGDKICCQLFTKKHCLSGVDATPREGDCRLSRFDSLSSMHCMVDDPGCKYDSECAEPTWKCCQGPCSYKECLPSTMTPKLTEVVSTRRQPRPSNRDLPPIPPTSGDEEPNDQNRDRGHNSRSPAQTDSRESNSKPVTPPSVSSRVLQPRVDSDTSTQARRRATPPEQSTTPTTLSTSIPTSTPASTSTSITMLEQISTPRSTPRSMPRNRSTPKPKPTSRPTSTPTPVSTRTPTSIPASTFSFTTPTAPVSTTRPVRVGQLHSSHRQVRQDVESQSVPGRETVRRFSDKTGPRNTAEQTQEPRTDGSGNGAEESKPSGSSQTTNGPPMELSARAANPSSGDTTLNTDPAMNGVEGETTPDVNEVTEASSGLQDLLLDNSFTFPTFKPLLPSSSNGIQKFMNGADDGWRSFLGWRNTRWDNGFFENTDN